MCWLATLKLFLARLWWSNRFLLHRLSGIFAKLLARFFLSNVFFDIANFLLSAAASGLIFYLATDQQFYRGVFSESRAFVIVSFLTLSALALIIFYFKRLMAHKRQTAFRQINEVMNESFNLLLTYFSDKMMLIHEASSRDRVLGYLRQISEERLFANLVTSLYRCLSNLFAADELEVKIDIFKRMGQKLVPLLDTLVNGSFTENKRSSSFAVRENVTDYESLAEYTYARTKVGHLSNIPKMTQLLALLDQTSRLKFKARYHLYYEHHGQTEAFQPGTIITFPLHRGEIRYGVLSIAFREPSIAGPLRLLGISEADFIRNISTFMARYTEFVITTNNGIDRIENLLSKKARREGRNQER